MATRFRIHVESGAAKLLLGDPTWRDLTAMASYYETAPLPTWIGWYAHQMTLWAHRACGVFVYVTELGLPLLICWRPRRLRAVAFAGMVTMQVAILDHDDHVDKQHHDHVQHDDHQLHDDDQAEEDHHDHQQHHDHDAGDVPALWRHV